MNLLNAVTEHAALLVALAVGTYWLVKRIVEAYRAAKRFVNSVVDERIPAVLHANLKNGIREMVTSIVTEAIAKHALAEEHVVHARLRELDGRLDKLERRAA